MRRAMLALLFVPGCSRQVATPPVVDPPAVAPAPPAAHDPVRPALRWLARHQNADGSWSVHAYVKRCAAGPCSPNPGDQDFDAGVTGLALLAFLGSGYSHLSREIHDEICFGDVVKKGLQWLMNHQDPEGCFGPRTPKYMYNHATCSLAMSEAYTVTGSMLFKDQAQRAADFLVAAQNPRQGWRYSYKCGDNDSSVTGWAVAALRSAQLAGLAVPKPAFDAARAWFDEVTDESRGRVGYVYRGGHGGFVPAPNAYFNVHEIPTAMAIVSRLAMDRNPRAPQAIDGARLLTKDPPEWTGRDIDFSYWYWGTRALAAVRGPDDAYWTAWSPRVKHALVRNQADDGCRAGSWEPADRWSTDGGRVYATAINVLTLLLLHAHRVVDVPSVRESQIGTLAAPLIEALGSDLLDERERAELALVKLGHGVRPFLEDAAASSDDAEIRARAQALLDNGKFGVALRHWMEVNRADWDDLMRKMRGGGPIEFEDETRPAGVAMSRLKCMNRRAVYEKLLSYIDHEDIGLGRGACAALSHLTGHKEPIPTEQSKAEIKARWQDWIERK